jgi:3-hydroxypropanoate dehydrogenase
MAEPLSAESLDQLFLSARTHTSWLPRPVDDALLVRLVGHMKMGPTSANCLPARIVFVKTAAAKAQLRPHIGAGNIEKTMSAPVTAIIGYDLGFVAHLRRLFPLEDATAWFTSDEAVQTTAFRNGSLQGGYFIMAARALGLDCGPMSGFDNAGVDATFFAGTQVKSNFLCNLGYGDASAILPRLPRLSFDEIASIR